VTDQNKLRKEEMGVAVPITPTPCMILDLK